MLSYVIGLALFNLYIKFPVSIIIQDWMASFNTKISFCLFSFCFNRQLSCVSPSGQLQAIVRKVPGNKGRDDIKQFLEVHVWVIFSI